MKRILATVAACLTATTGIVAAAAPASAGQGTGNPILEATPTVVAPDRVTDITVTGTDYLVPPHAEGVNVFGGVYVFFGWVADPNHFGPSIRNSTNNDGTLNVTYAYPGDGGDANVRDDGSGVVRLVAFTPGGESGEATNFHMDRNGNWTTTLRIYGSTFTTTNPATGETHNYDCTQVQCGVFTIGAHGIASATNEKFVPITFDATAGQAPPAEPPPALESAPAAPASPANPATTTTPTTTTTTTTVPATTTAVATTPSTTLAPASAAETDDDAPPDGVIAADVISVTSTGSNGAQVAVLIAIVAAIAAAAIAFSRWRKRRGTEPASELTNITPPATPGGIRP